MKDARPSADAAIRILTLVPHPSGIAPGQRYRTEQWAPYLREHGIELEFSPFADADLNDMLYEPGRFAQKTSRITRRFFTRFGDAWRAADFDAVLVQREASLVGPALAERLARSRGPAFIFDFDDAVYLPYVSPTNRYLSLLKFPWKTRALCRMADLVWAGNESLAGFARRLARPATSVSVVPSTISLRAYPHPRRRSPRSIPVIGWTGSHSSVQYLRPLEGVLRELARRTPFRLLLVGPVSLAIPTVEVEVRPWRSETEVEDLWDMDLGLMPLPDLPWTRGKCGMKALQYMAAGIPAVVSPVGVNREIVTPGVTGFHATTEAEWVDSLATLLANPDLRTRLGTAGRAEVETRYSAEVHVPRLAGMLREVVARGAPGSRTA
jgi:glycosyltransferase involved in cell wall biosynthesis